jgi:CubicO group peptidase (beta-lactamase class C family)
MSGGLSAAVVAELRAVARRPVDDGSMPGLVALVACGDQVHADAVGRLGIDGPPVRPDSLFRISSTTKPITAAATLAVVAEGLLDLDEPVDRLLPELAGRRVLRTMSGPLEDTVPAHRPITARDLLTFTFGFGSSLEQFTAAEPWPVVRATDELGLATLGPPDPARQPEPDTWIAGLGSLPLMAQPGERWLYNTGASVLGVLLARAAGAPLPEVLRSRVLGPLGMSDTGFWAEDPARLAEAYRPGPDGLVVIDPPDGAWSRPPAFADGAAGLVSTAGDLLAFARMLLRGGDPVLPPGAVREMTTGRGAGDDHRAAHPRPAGRGRAGAGLLRRGELVVGPGGAGRRGLRLGRRAGHLMAGRPAPRPGHDRADPADVRGAGELGLGARRVRAAAYAALV